MVTLECHVILQYPFPVIKKAWELGLINGHIPQEYGMLFSCSLSLSKFPAIIFNFCVSLFWLWLCEIPPQLKCVKFFIMPVEMIYFWQVGELLLENLSCSSLFVSRWNGLVDLRQLPHHRGVGLRLHRSTDCYGSKLSGGKFLFIRVVLIHQLLTSY